MLLDNPLRNREAQAGSTGVAAASRVGTVEALKDVWHILWRDANAGIAYQDFNSGVTVVQS